MAVVRNLIVRAGADFSSLNQEMKKAKKNITEFKSGVSGAVKGIGIALAGVGFGALAADATRTAMDVEAAMQQINRLMGDNAHAFNGWAREQASAYNMSYANAVKYGAIFGNLLNTFSSGAEDTKNKTIDILQTSAVVASGTGRTMEDVMWRIRSGLLGNTEAIEDLGINVYVNMLKSTNAFRQFAGDKSWDQLDFQTQQLIRYYGILEQANKKFGTEINVNTNSALQGLQAALGNVKMALGQAFLPILSRVLPILTAMANWLYKVISLIGAFIRALFGYKDPAKSVVNTNKAIGGSVGGLSDTYKEAGDAAEKSGSKTAKAAKKAKKALESLAGFDEINKLPSAQDQTDSGGGSGGGGGGGAGGGGYEEIPLPDPGDASVFGEISDRVQKAADKVKAVFRGLKNFLSDHKDIIVSLMAGLAAGMAAALIGKNWPKIIGGIAKSFRGLTKAIRAAWLAATGLPGLIVLAIAALTAAFVYFYRTNEAFKGVVDGALLAIKNAAIDLWKNVLVPFGEWVATTFLKAWDDLKPSLMAFWEETLIPLANWMKTKFVEAWGLVQKAAIWLWKNVILPFGNYLKIFHNDIIVPLGKLLKDVFANSISKVIEVGKALWKDVIVPMAKFMKEAWKPTLDALVAVFLFLWKYALAPLAAFIGGTVMVVFKTFIATVSFLYYNVLQPLSTFIVYVLKNSFSALGGIINSVKSIFVGFMNFITGVFTGNWNKAWEGMKQTFKGVFQSLYSVVKGPLNLIIDGINQVITGLNRIKVSVPDWVPGYGGQKFGMSISKIPRLATGGYVGANKPLLAMIGDNKNEGEIVAPESKLYEQAYKAIKDAMGGKGQEIVINIGGTTVFRKVIDGINEAQRQAGKTLIEV